MRLGFLAGLSCLMLCAGSTSAAVVETSPSGFQLKYGAVFKAAPDVVYRALTEDVGDWWNPEHTFSGDAHNLHMDAHAQGCFCETLPKGGSVKHLTVVFAAPGVALRLEGALGPLQAGGVSGSMTWAFEAKDGGTQVTLTYNVGGYMPGGLDKIAPAADGMLGEQFARFKSYVETGKPVAGGK